MFVIFTAWCKSRSLSEDIENCHTEELAERLRRFYAEARKMDGHSYSKNALCGLRSSIHRYLTSAPHNRQINIMRDAPFKRANNMLVGVLKKQKNEGLDHTRHHQNIQKADLNTLMESDVLNSNIPEGLQKLVWFLIQFNFCRRGGEGLRELKKDSFEFKTDGKGLEYVQLRYNEATKNHPGGLIDTKEPQKKMFATGQPKCPA